MASFMVAELCFLNTHGTEYVCGEVYVDRNRKPPTRIEQAKEASSCDLLICNTDWDRYALRHSGLIDRKKTRDAKHETQNTESCA
jgi:hypothetical protein